MGDSPPRFNLSEQIALRIPEAAALVGLSEGAFREHLLPRCPKVYVGRAIVIPRRLFEEFIETLAQAEQEATEETAAALLDRVS